MSGEKRCRAGSDDRARIGQRGEVPPGPRPLGTLLLAALTSALETKSATTPNGWARLRGHRSTGPLQRVTGREIAVCLLILAALGVAVFGSHVLEGGFIMDDWSNAAKSRYQASCCGTGISSTQSGFPGDLASYLNDGPAGYHLGLTVVAPLAHYFLGVHTGWHLALAIVLAALMSAVFYGLMRTLGLERLHAGLIAALALIFPFSDSTRLWAMASYNQLAAALVMGGALVALHGLERRDSRPVLAHALALAMYAAGILVYELLAGWVLAAGLLYVWRAPGRAALLRWGADIALVAITLWFVKQNTIPRAVLPLDRQLDHARFIADSYWTLLSQAAVPFGSPSPLLVALPVVLVLVAAVVALFALPGDHRLAHGLSRWLKVSAIAVIGIVAGYALIVPADYGGPLDVGIENRLNMLAGMATVALLYATAMLAWVLVGHRIRWRPAGAILGLAAAAFVAVGYIDRLRENSSRYDRSFTMQQQVLRDLRDAFPEPPEGSFIYTFGHQTFVAPGIPVFAWIWDLNPAIKLTYRDASLGGHPVLADTEFKCGRERMWPLNNGGFFELYAVPYGRVYFVDVRSGDVARVRDRRACMRERERFTPTPLPGGCRFAGGGPGTRLSWTCPGRSS